MLVKSFSFSKLTKNSDKITEELNKFLDGKTLHSVTQSENPSQGRLVITLFYTIKPSKIKATVIKSGDVNSIDDDILSVLKGKELRFVTQSYSQGNIFTCLFTEKNVVKNVSKKEK